MIAALYDLSLPANEADGIGTIGARVRDQPRKPVPLCPRCMHTARVGVQPPKPLARSSRQDDEAASHFLPPTGTGSSVRAAIAAGHELARLSATLAFFCSRSSSRLAPDQIGRLRV